MAALRIIAYIGAAILIFFGVLFIWGAFSPEGSTGWVVVGVVSVGIGFGLIALAALVLKPRIEQNSENTQNVTLQIDLPGEMSVDRLECTSCGAELGSDDVKLVQGAAMVNCPYCGAVYSLTEQPKW